jgi:hypothetical protein
VVSFGFALLAVFGVTHNVKQDLYRFPKIRIYSEKQSLSSVPTHPALGEADKKMSKPDKKRHFFYIEKGTKLFGNSQKCGHGLYLLPGTPNFLAAADYVVRRGGRLSLQKSALVRQKEKETELFLNTGSGEFGP